MSGEIPTSDAINVGEVVDASRVGGLQVRVNPGDASFDQRRIT
jgi:hypothetical protein